MKAPTPLRRSRSNDGAPNRVTSVIPLRPQLAAKLLAEFAEPQKRKAPQIYHGPKAATFGPKCDLSDEQFLAIRKMAAHCGMRAKEIAERTGQSLERVQGVLSYTTRVHLDPGPVPPVET